MKKIVLVALIATTLALAGCSGNRASSAADISSSTSVSSGSSAQAAQAVQSSTEPSSSAPANNDSATAAASTITMQANDAALQVTLADTEAAAALAKQLADGPISVSLHPYGGFEKVGSLPQALPTSDRQVATAPGDVMLYQGNQISVFYGTNAWEYTPLGHINGATPENLLEAFGDGDVTIELSL